MTTQQSYDRPAIMTRAWREYRFQTAWKADRAFRRRLSAHLLKEQWDIAKAERVRAIVEVERRTRLVSASQDERRRAQLREELRARDYLDFIPWDRHRALSAELASLAR